MVSGPSDWSDNANCHIGDLLCLRFVNICIDRGTDNPARPLCFSCGPMSDWDAYKLTLNGLVSSSQILSTVRKSLFLFIPAGGSSDRPFLPRRDVVVSERGGGGGGVDEWITGADLPGITYSQPAPTPGDQRQTLSIIHHSFDVYGYGRLTSLKRCVISDSGRIHHKVIPILDIGYRKDSKK